MQDAVSLHLQKRKIYGTCRITGSKSISNRLLIMSFLARTKNHLQNISTSDDTKRLERSLKQVKICGSSRIPMIINTANSGTVMRFLTAYLSAQPGLWHLTGLLRMRQRPVKELVEALQHLGADISYCCREGYPPINVKGCQLKGKKVAIGSSVSSQFVSALMLIGPCLKNGLEITMTGHVVSFPYIEMTCRLMHEFGIDCQIKKNVITIPHNTYQPKNMEVEPDWSSASYWYEIVALADKAEVVLPGFKKESIQGDRACADIYDQLGVHTDFSSQGIILSKKPVEANALEFDFTGFPDLVPAVMATCAAKKIPAEFKGVGHLRYKESDRIEGLTRELAKVGASFKTSGDIVQMIPGNEIPKNREIIFETCADHRLAMALAPLVLKLDQVSIDNPEVVEKSYPGFWEDLQNTGLCTVEKTG